MHMHLFTHTGYEYIFDTNMSDNVGKLTQESEFLLWFFNIVQFFKSTMHITRIKYQEDKNHLKG